VGTIAAKLANVPSVATLHNELTDPEHYHPIRERLEGFCLSYLAKDRIAVGELVAESRRKMIGRRSIRVISNAVDEIPSLPIEERRSVRRDLIGDPDRTLLITVGRFAPSKGYFDLLIAFDQIRKKHPGIALVIVGTGTLFDEVRDEIGKLDLGDSVHLIGKRSDVPRLLAASDLYVSASHWEGLPVSILEAMSAGLPVVATKVGELPKVVPEDSGSLVPPGDPKALADAVIGFLDRAGTMKSYGDNARTFVSQNYSAKVWFEKILSVYEAVLERSSNDKSPIKNSTAGDPV